MRSTPPHADHHHQVRSAIVFALGGFVLLGFGDAVVKSMAGQWSPPAMAALRYTLGAIGLVALLAAREGRKGFAMPRPGIQMLRGAAVSLATVGFFSALFVMPLAEATTIQFVSPILTAMLAPLVLAEPARRETWIASLVAFVGVVIVLRPNVAVLGWGAALPLAAALGMSILVLANRAVAGSASALAMQAFVALWASPILVAVTAIGHLSGFPPLAVDMPPLAVIAKCALIACTASTAHWLIYLGTTRAGAATIAPVTYVQLIVAVSLGWLWFGDRPDLISLGGGLVIIAAGLYLWRASRNQTPAA